MFEKTLDFIRNAPFDELKSELAKYGFNFISKQEQLIKSISSSVSSESFPSIDFGYVSVSASRVSFAPIRSGRFDCAVRVNSFGLEPELTNWQDECQDEAA